MLTLINRVKRSEPFDHTDWVFEAKFGGFRAAADIIRGRLILRTATGCNGSSGCLICCPRAMSSMATLSCSMILGALSSTSCFLDAAHGIVWLQWLIRSCVRRQTYGSYNSVNMVTPSSRRTDSEAVRNAN